MENIQAITHTLSNLIEPKLKWKIGELNLIKDVHIKGHELFITIQLVTDDPTQKNEFRENVFQSLIGFGFEEIDLTLEKVNTAHQGLDSVKHIILVSSGKGGVGKSTISVNLATTLKKNGFQVGLMDADVYGPSIPIMMGISERPQVLDNEVLAPIDAFGIKTISVGNLVPKDKAVSWRAQLVSGTILQFIRKVNWGHLDYLIIDMPPGTGDIQLTIAHELKVDGVVIVSMPQEIVIGDVSRSIAQYKEKEIPILGIIQNMTSYTCTECGHVQNIFPGTGEEIEDIKNIATLVLEPELCRQGNIGVPYVLKKESGPIVEEFGKVVTHLKAVLAK